MMIRILPRGGLGKRKDTAESRPFNQTDEKTGRSLCKRMNNYLLTLNMKRSILFWYIKDGMTIRVKRRVL